MREDEPQEKHEKVLMNMLDIREIAREQTVIEDIVCKDQSKLV